MPDFNDNTLDPDSLGYQARIFRFWIDTLIASNAASLPYSFKRLQDAAQVSVVTSADGLFRIYSWDNWMGGTMHNFDAVYQWRGNVGVYRRIPERDGEGDPGSWYSRIYTVDINGQLPGQRLVDWVAGGFQFSGVERLVKKNILKKSSYFLEISKIGVHLHPQS